jgi:hypothetical protein
MEPYDTPMAAIDSLDLPEDKRKHVRVSYGLYSLAYPAHDTKIGRMLTCPLGAFMKGVDKEFGDVGVRTPEDVTIALKRAFYALGDLAETLSRYGLDEGDLIADLVGCSMGSVREGLFELMPGDEKRYGKGVQP